VNRFRVFYGAQPLHLLAAIISFALVVAGFVGWLTPGSDARGILLWLIGCLLGTQLVLLPLAWLLDRIAFGVDRGHRSSQAHASTAFVRVPALLSALLLLVFAPLIFRADTATFEASTGTSPAPYLDRWLIATGCMFAISAVVYAVTLARSRRSPPHSHPPPGRVDRSRS
jgi:hypothetical protein